MSGQFKIESSKSQFVSQFSQISSSCVIESVSSVFYDDVTHTKLITLPLSVLSLGIKHDVDIKGFHPVQSYLLLFSITHAYNIS